MRTDASAGAGMSTSRGRRWHTTPVSEALARVLERASTSPAYREWLAADPDGALAEYDLTPDERAALLARDPRPLRPLHVERHVPINQDTP
jgi:hypothetical protein